MCVEENKIKGVSIKGLRQGVLIGFETGVIVC